MQKQFARAMLEDLQGDGIQRGTKLSTACLQVHYVPH